MKADDQLAESRLTGYAQYARKRLDMEKELRTQLANEGHSGQAPAEVAAALQKFDDETYQKEMEHVRSLHQAREEASVGGLKGAARVTGDRDNRVARINSDPSLAVNPDEAKQQRDAANAEMYQKLKDLEDSFTQTTLSNITERTDAQMGAFEKIDAEGKKALADFNNAYANAFQDKDGNDLGTPAVHKAAEAARAQIAQRTQEQKNQLTVANNAEDLQYAQEAASAEARVRENGLMGWVAQYKDATAQIRAAQAEHLAKMYEAAHKSGMSDDDTEVQQRKVDIDRQANAQIEQQNQQMQHQIAGNLQEAFTDPVNFIKSAMEKMFFEIVAGWIMRMKAFQSIFGTTMGGLQPGGGAGEGTSSIGGILGGALGIGGSGSGSSTASSVPGGTASMTSANSHAGGSGTASISSASSVGNTISSGISGVSSLAQMTGITGTASQASPWASQPDFNGSMTGDTPDLTSAQQAAQAGGSGTASMALGIAGAAAGGYNAYQGTVNAFKSGNPLTGALADGAEGAAIGSLAGPEGALIGAAAGAAVGAATGLAGMVDDMGSKMAARDYYNKQVFPQLDAMMTNPSGDFQAGIASANATANSALMYMGTHFGTGPANWVNDNYMKKELQKVDQLIADTAKGGRQFTTLSASQFHSGGVITGFGDYGTSSTEGMIHAMLGETVMNPSASSTHASTLAAMNSGASAADVAGRFLSSSARKGVGVASSPGGSRDIHIHTLDTKTMSSWLKSGGAQLITKHQNDYSAQYAGDGISG